MITVPVRGDAPYEIQIDAGLLDRVGAQIRPLTKAQSVLVISDSNVAPLYGQRVVASLEAAGFSADLFVFPAGEAHKKLDTVESMLEALQKAHLTRSDLVVALGGGVTGDMAGFAAAIYLRGIDFVQIPTTLLAQIDSSVGGKTGCDLSFGKNLAGAFHNPLAVYMDPDTLSTLPAHFLLDGMGEAVKYGCIFSEPLFTRLEREDFRTFLPELIQACVELKRDVVEEDFKESGRRTLLNFGHTLGHAIEKEQNYVGLSHGRAVSVGMALVTRASEARGLTAPGTYARLAALLERLGLPTSVEIAPARLCQAALSDKKLRGSTLRLVYLRAIGDSDLYALPGTELPAFLAEVTQ